MFHIHFEIIRLNKRRGLFQNGEQPPGGQAVVGVVGKPRLQTSKRVGAEGSAAINELFFY